MAKTITVPFKPHFYQEQIRENLKRFSVLVCHRRFGKTVLAVNLLIRWACQTKRKNWRAGYIAPLYRQAKEIAWDYIQHYASVVPGIKFNQNELKAEFPNGNRITLLGADNPDSLRGPYWDCAIFDEYAQIRPKVFPEIIRPALVDRKGWAVFIGTPMGHNHFFDLWKDAKADPDNWAALMYRASQTSILDPSELAQARKEMSPEQYEQEFECSFEAAITGAYFGPLMQDALDEKRVTEVPYDPALLVHTAWDFGVDDATAIWFFQLTPAGAIKICDYHEQNNEGLDFYLKLLKEKNYNYGQHLAPHDAKAREPIHAETRIEYAAKLGVKFTVVPRDNVADGINAARSIIPRCWFDERKCDRGIQALKTYRKEYSDRLSTFRDSPLHDWASHGADAFRYLATGLSLINSTIPVLKSPFTVNRLRPSPGGWML